jgi:hypothetical protein
MHFQFPGGTRCRKKQVFLKKEWHLLRSGFDPDSDPDFDFDEVVPGLFHQNWSSSGSKSLSKSKHPGSRANLQYRDPPAQRPV